MGALNNNAAMQLGITWTIESLQSQQNQTERLGLSDARLWQIHRIISMQASYSVQAQSVHTNPQWIINGTTYALNLLHQVMKLQSGLPYFDAIQQAWKGALRFENTWLERSHFACQATSEDHHRPRRFNEGLHRAVVYMLQRLGSPIRAQDISAFGIEAVIEFMSRTTGAEHLYFQHPAEVCEGIITAFQVLHHNMHVVDSNLDDKLLHQWEIDLMSFWRLPEVPY